MFAVGTAGAMAATAEMTDGKMPPLSIPIGTALTMAALLVAAQANERAAKAAGGVAVLILTTALLVTGGRAFAGLQRALDTRTLERTDQ